ncbi:flavodoxin-dependent (E)-4-hydroxy-3-methylbut-2-enyl-diphosphate synthase [Catenibacterium mitsuokai]|jgi:(E)-4-hydroxy-3-methylbut-2-enyl-diphosphate synthase|uniref:4-hydroxy-3-methylbut-2-en-1-yl diphosphate synthase (flavodoxin) n=2 Tax=Catenibacterium mitsuokai TaxID=100886 RepID=A0AAW4MYC9_9FIRM|nr:flavodoxin-dependent (E)-4-hydroxy-3-methylbut-2-enyl-diphosphate synthase [Catenibacterium mitsuokai]MBV3367526.1 flavodoxin-dependent (E)-4-hydroxy-3-methylbut-2-enyl-diphosphate synthase [Catenibacterium mitsuokai]MBV3371626.1 flavodoxin-dependent (E)-4-hydroxy-3-methylbut-2-enyl-diphosphate synthase [Catenibacterium mitsuokai]MBV3376934.1 flavodoxin-dependent (E)-4-hydroxy-3-methylbut-2-enyl-diphosphate synthase [Catenibacterium mitsuokai]MBV3378643.1 flavodoxin-dependent (E)-4-hydroxy-3
MLREETRSVQVGNLTIGGNNHVVIQSMCNTKTKNVEATIKQINALEQAGCELVRVAVFDKEDAYAIKEIKKGIHIPLVADIHFDYKLALIAIESGIDKVRINPGNIGSIEKVKAVVDACKEKHIPIRIGVNGGSLEKDILEKYGEPTPEGMVESAMKHVKILEDLDFHDIVISLKSSNTMLTIKAYELASKTFPYPLHVGVTEAGTALGGTIKSALGIGTLLYEGIGNTIRVSLSDDPVEEIKVAKILLKELGLLKGVPTLVSCPTCGRIQYDLIPIAKEMEDFLKDIHLDITVAIMGCAVNGPGEARHADIGIAGGVGEGLLIKHGEIVKRVKQEDMVQTLKDEILKMVEEKSE